MTRMGKCGLCQTFINDAQNHYCTPVVPLGEVYNKFFAETARADAAEAKIQDAETLAEYCRQALTECQDRVRAEAARSDAAERLAERYRVALEDAVDTIHSEYCGSGTHHPVCASPRQALASAPDNCQHPDGFCPRCGSWGVCKCREGG